MSDNILTAVLTFSLLAGGTAAIGSEMFGARQVALASAPVVVMPQVTVTAPRATPAPIVTMPQVTITAQRVAEPAPVVTMPEVTITAQRVAGPDPVVTLPLVVVTVKRETLTVAAETSAIESPRVQ